MTESTIETKIEFIPTASRCGCSTDSSASGCCSDTSEAKAAPTACC